MSTPNGIAKEFDNNLQEEVKRRIECEYKKTLERVEQLELLAGEHDIKLGG